MIVGIVGLGRMGAAMAQRLSGAGMSLVGWDRNELAVRAFIGDGKTGAPHARAVVEAANVVITTVTDDAAVDSIFHGSDGVLSGPVAARLFIEMSTLQPLTVRALAPELEAHGAAIVDAPVLGTIPNVLDGSLTALAGGTEAQLERAQPILAHLTRRVVHMGPIGSGHAMKLAVNLGLAAYIQALGESLALGEREGLDLHKMLDVLANAPTANGWLAGRKGVVTGEVDNVALDIRTLRKDLLSAVATGALAGATMPLSASVLAALSAAVAAGIGDRDIGVMTHFMRDAMVQRPNR